MPLPRFQNLDTDKQSAILVAAAEEFAEHGFAGASFNQIIQRAGISKGAMYYYFADKDDLFFTVLDVALNEWLAEVGFPFQADSARAFWDACHDMYARSLRFMLRSPRNAALCLSVSRARARMEGHPRLLEHQELMMAWTRGLVTQGRALGALREDLPTDLVVHSSLALMEAGDVWLSERWSELTEDDVDATAAMMIGMFRRLGEAT